MKNELVDIECLLKYKTAKAVLIDYGEKEDTWLPLSQVEIHPSDNGKTWTITMPRWLAMEKGLI